MRTLLELFKILKANKKLYISKNCSGLCKLSSYLRFMEIINYAEYDKLLTYIDTHRPEADSKYYNESENNSAWYWPLYKWYPRLLWINAQIKILKP